MQVPKISLTVPIRYRDCDLVLIILAIEMTSSKVMFPLCLTIENKNYDTSQDLKNYGNVTVLLLLAVTRRLFQSLDDQGRSGRNN